LLNTWGEGAAQEGIEVDKITIRSRLFPFREKAAANMDILDMRQYDAPDMSDSGVRGCDWQGSKGSNSK